ADGDKAAILRAPFVDLKPASIAQLPFKCLAASAVMLVGHAALEGEWARMGVDFVARHTGFQRPDRKACIFAELRVRHDEAIVGIPQDEGFRKDRKSTRLNSSHVKISYAVFCLKKKST